MEVKRWIMTEYKCLFKKAHWHTNTPTHRHEIYPFPLIFCLYSHITFRRYHRISTYLSMDRVLGWFIFNKTTTKKLSYYPNTHNAHTHTYKIL